jgi:hypothetical protein
MLAYIQPILQYAFKEEEPSFYFRTLKRAGQVIIVRQVLIFIQLKLCIDKRRIILSGHW